jgi:signal transduction histidine kinase
MASRGSSRSPYVVLAVFMAVAMLSIGTLGWLVWQLLQQDAQAELQRRQERLEQAADRAGASMQRALLEFQALAAVEPVPDEIPPGVSLISIEDGRVTARPPGSLLYLPRAAMVRSDAPAGALGEGERLEFADGRQDLGGALKVYARFVSATDRRVRAAALAGVARVHRKRGNEAEALEVYQRLGDLDDATVAGLPAGLIARAARASIYEASGDRVALEMEAAALQHHLATGAWPLVKSEYEFYRSEAFRWLGTAPVEDGDARARAEALEWLWDSRLSLRASGRRALALASGPVLVAWATRNGDLRAAVAGPQHLAAMSTVLVPEGFVATLTDAEGRILLGPSPPQARHVAVRTGPAVGLPWTLHVAAAPGQHDEGTTSRRQLLLLVFGTVALVMMAGGYFILRAIARELRVARLQSDFVAAVSHEFRSPLTALAHIAQMLASDRVRSNADRHISYRVLVSETERLRGLVEGLLDFGRFEQGAEFRCERLNLPALVRGTVAEFQERVARDGYAVELSCPAGELYIEADREALSRALWNLLDNAVKYSPDCRTVWVDLESDPLSVRVSVRDRGLGIPAGEQRRIFDRFVRGGEGKARRITGTGIGLAMVRQIVQAHGGAIRVKSAPGHGSCFTIELKTTPHARPGGGLRSRPAQAAAPTEGSEMLETASEKPGPGIGRPEAGRGEREVLA